MSKKVDLTGRRFGRLLVVKELETIKCQVRWECICDCGSTCTRQSSALSRPNRISCGCWQREIASELGKSRRQHSQSQQRAASIWRGMRNRCNNKNNYDYESYGGRGIRVCEEWDSSFEAFYRDMGEPGFRMEIERIDNDADYSKENCRWATRKQQMQNRRNTIFVIDGDVKISLADWCRKNSRNYKSSYALLRKHGSLSSNVRRAA